MAVVICATARDCSSPELAMLPTSVSTSAMSCEIRSKARRVSSAIDTPEATRCDASSIRSLLSRAARADRPARLRTSCATTAKPRPYCPARAASTAAFKARRFVWKAISSITLMILAISSEDDRIASIACTIPITLSCPSFVAVEAELARWLAILAELALARTCVSVSSAEAEISSTEVLCTWALSASECALEAI